VDQKIILTATIKTLVIILIGSLVLDSQPTFYEVVLIHGINSVIAIVSEPTFFITYGEEK